MSSIVPSPFSRIADGAISGLVSGVGQVFNGVKTFAALIIASAGIQVASLFNTNGTNAADVGVKVGVSTADGTVVAGATLLAVRTGIDGTEVDYARFRKAGSTFVPVLALDTKNATNVPAIVISGNGQGDTGIGFEGTNAQGGCDIGLGSASTLGFAFRSTNRTQTFYVNNDAFSASAVAAFSFLASESAGLKAKDLMRVEGASDRTGNLLNLRRGTTSQFAVTSTGGVTALGTINAPMFTWNTTGGLLSSGGLSRLIGASGERWVIASTLGASAADVAVSLGTSVADASVNSAAKLWSVRTGITGTEVEHAYLTKGGLLGFPAGVSGAWTLDFAAGQFFVRTSGTAVAQFLNSGGFRSGYTIDINPAFGAFLSLQLHSDGRVNQRGTDSSGSPGAATADRPIGKNAIAVGASSVVITNSLVTAASVILITPHARDATCKELIAVPAAGSFTVSGTAAATAALPFSWEVKGLL